jgi:hypothetical protein
VYTVGAQLIWPIAKVRGRPRKRQVPDILSIAAEVMDLGLCPCTSLVSMIANRWRSLQVALPFNHFQATQIAQLLQVMRISKAWPRNHALPIRFDQEIHGPHFEDEANRALMQPPGF